MDYIEYRKEGNKPSDPQYIPGCEWSSIKRKIIEITLTSEERSAFIAAGYKL